MAGGSTDGAVEMPDGAGSAEDEVPAPENGDPTEAGAADQADGGVDPAEADGEGDAAPQAGATP